MIAKHGADFLLDFDAEFLRQTIDPQAGRSWQLLFVFGAGVTIPPVLPIGVIITFWLGLSAPGIWFRAGGGDEERQMRLTAISRYICAPWALLIVPTALFVVMFSIATGLVRTSEVMAWGVLYSYEATMLLLLAGVCWTNMRMLARTTRCGPFFLILAGVSIPIAWALSVAIGLGLFPCFVGLVWIVIDSLRR
jgi:hypothetical protein